MKPKILVIGGTGAMGVYLVPALLEKGYAVDVLSLDQRESTHSDLRYFTGSAKDPATLNAVLANRYDAIVDFMIYGTEEFRAVHKKLLGAAGHYVFLSTYRIYANEDALITERSPRLLDVSPDKALVASEDYCIYKAREEDILKSSGFGNYTIVRPSITFSKFRYQLVTLEAPYFINRIFDGKPVYVPHEAMNVQSTMTWAGDTAKMFCAIVLNPAALGETYTLATGEHQTWGKMADYYRDILGADIREVDKQTYLGFLDPARGCGATWQLEYDRLFDRAVDNSKILKLAGLTQADLTPVKTALEAELSRLPRDYRFPGGEDICRRMDAYR